MLLAALPDGFSVPRRVIVTGAAGFIGARTCELLLMAGCEVTGIDNLNDYYDVRLKRHRLAGLAAPAHAARFSFRELDVEDRAGVMELVASWRPDAIINLAARAGVRYSLENPHVYLTTNTQGTLHVLEAMRAFQVPKLVLASTSSLYAGAAMPFREDADVTRPLSPYAASKLAAEALAHTYHHVFKIDVSIVRYFTVYGPAGRPDMSPFRFVKWIDEGTPIQLYGDGSQTRDFTYIDDIAAGTVAALLPVGYEVFNLGGGNRPLPMQEMIALLERYLGKTAVIQRSAFHAADMRDTQADITKARTRLGWAPQVPPAEGLRRTVEWHVAHRDFVRDLAV